ncbi:MAG: DUF935 domain-containing protein [Hyphomicrobiaceae bacterium]|nr:DUF935 domain-containing protein [Hyphomicrobiaceae bacterium]
MASVKRQLLGPDGEPISTANLKHEIAAPTLGGTRPTMWDQVAPGLTPQRLASILRAAEDGDHRDYLTLAEEMEERELHYISVIGTRKRALTGLPIVIEAATDEDRDIEIADAVRDVVEMPEMRDLLDHLVDAFGKGYAVSEIIWETSAKQWRPRAFRDRDPRHFLFDRLTGRDLRLSDAGVPDGVPLAPFKFVRHIPRLKSGLPVRGGLAKPAAWAFIFKSYTIKDWMAFCEVYGMPLRIGRYGPQATEEDRRRLLTAVRNIGTDAAAIVPESMAIEFAEVKGGSSRQPVFHGFAEYLDQQISKLVLGQTMTTDSGASMAQAKVHENVRRDILIADARQLEATVNRDLIRPFIDLNYGPQKHYPAFTLPVAEPEDLKALSDNLKKLVPLGLRISESEVRDRFGFTDPDEGEAILGRGGLIAFDRDAQDDDAGEDNPADDAASEAEPPSDDTDDDAKPARQRRSRAKASNSRTARKAKSKPKQKPKRKPANGGQKSACGCGCGAKANNAVALRVPDELEPVVAFGLEAWEEVVDPMLKPLRDAVNTARDFDGFLALLPTALAKMDTERFVATLAASMAVARGLGDIGVEA